jgi:hypothetical protein
MGLITQSIAVVTGYAGGKEKRCSSHWQSGGLYVAVFLIGTKAFLLAMTSGPVLGFTHPFIQRVYKEKYFQRDEFYRNFKLAVDCLHVTKYAIQEALPPYV